MQDGVLLADLFLDKGLVTYLQGQRSPRQDFKADPSKNITKLPLQVLTNRGTAGPAGESAAPLAHRNPGQLGGRRTDGERSLRAAGTREDGGRSNASLG